MNAACASRLFSPQLGPCTLQHRVVMPVPSGSRSAQPGDVPGYWMLEPSGPGTSLADSEDSLRFAELAGVAPMIETYPLEKVGEA